MNDMALPAEPDRDFTGTLAAGMSLLSSFREGDASLAHRDLVARTGLSKANVSRLAYTLVALGFLRRDPVTGRYRLGSPVLSMGYPLLAGMRIRQVARPFMREMADRARGVVSMGLRDRGQMIYVESTRSDAAPALSGDIGTTLPLLESAMGLAWLVAVPTPDSERALNQALVATGRQGRSEARRPVREAAQAFRSDGFIARAVDRDRTWTVAVPTRGPIDGDLVVFDCVARQRRQPGGIQGLGQRLALMVRAIEGAMSMR